MNLYFNLVVTFFLVISFENSILVRAFPKNEENLGRKHNSTSKHILTSTPITTSTSSPINDKLILEELIKRGDELINKGQNALQKFRDERNYFSAALEKELILLMRYMKDLKKECQNIDSNNPFMKEFVFEAQRRVEKYSQHVDELLLLGQKGTDGSYIELLQMIDALKQRAYADVGFLYMKNKINKANGIKLQIAQIEELESNLKSINFKITPELANNFVEQILEHERKLQEELFRIEYDEIELKN